MDNMFLIVTELLSSDVLFQITSEDNVYKYDNTCCYYTFKNHIPLHWLLI